MRNSRNLRARWLGGAALALGVFTLLLGCAALGQVEQDASQRWVAPGTRVKLASHFLHLHCMGEGAPALVLEAGMSGWSQDWSRVQSRLAEQGQVCSYDRAGYGWSDPAPGPQDALAALADLRMALDSAGVPAGRLMVGHSYGGLLAGLYARRYPQDVAGLAFIDAVGRDYEAQFPAERYQAFRSSLRRMLWLADLSARWGVPQLLGQPATVIANRLPADQAERAVPMSFSVKHYRTLAQENLEFDRSLVLALSSGALPDVPTLVLTSQAMRDFPPGLEDDVMKAAWKKNQVSIANEAKTQVVEFEGSGHYLHIDQPEAVVQQLNALRARVRTGLPKR